MATIKAAAESQFRDISGSASLSLLADCLAIFRQEGNKQTGTKQNNPVVDLMANYYE